MIPKTCEELTIAIDNRIGQLGAEGSTKWAVTGEEFIKFAGYRVVANGEIIPIKFKTKADAIAVFWLGFLHYVEPMDRGTLVLYWRERPQIVWDNDLWCYVRARFLLSDRPVLPVSAYEALINT